MSWMAGYCEECKSPQDYKHCWGYEKPDGLEYYEGKLLCQECIRKLKESEKK